MAGSSIESRVRASRLAICSIASYSGRMPRRKAIASRTTSAANGTNNLEVDSLVI